MSGVVILCDRTAAVSWNAMVIAVTRLAGQMGHHLGSKIRLFLCHPILVAQMLSTIQPQVAGLRRFGVAALDLAWVAAKKLV
jgi:fructose-1,6-bisphosphatase/inositol monophosphatase family enzyme